MEYYVVNKSGVFREHLIYGKNFTVKSENLDSVFHIQCYLNEMPVFAERKHLKIRLVLFTAGHVAPERVLSKCLLKELFL